MKTITFDISDRDYKLLSRLAELRGLTTTEVARELVLESRHTIPAQINFLRRAMRELKLMSRLSDLSREVIDGIDLYSPTYDKLSAKKITKR